MHLRALRYLVAVAEDGHFGRAAARMHVSQPSVSQAVARLERQFGAQLLDRSGGRVVPTETGERVLAEVRAFLRHIDEAARIATTPDTGTRLRIACTPFFSMWVTVQLLTPYREAHPTAEVSVAELDVSAQARAPVAGQIDVAAGEPLMADPRLRETTMREDPCAIRMSIHHPLAQFDEIALSRLAGVPIADGDPQLHPVYHSWIRETLRSAGVTPTFAPPTRDSPSAISRIIDGTMVSIAADILPEGAIPGLAVRRVGDPVRWRWATTMLREAPKPSSVAFTNWARLRG